MRPHPAAHPQQPITRKCPSPLGLSPSSDPAPLGASLVHQPSGNMTELQQMEEWTVVTSALVCYPGGGGVLAEYMTEVSNRASYCKPKKINEPATLHPKTTGHQNFLLNTGLNTSILIYSIKQTLRPKKICDRSLDPKKY